MDEHQQEVVALVLADPEAILVGEDRRIADELVDRWKMDYLGHGRFRITVAGREEYVRDIDRAELVYHMSYKMRARRQR